MPRITANGHQHVAEVRMPAALWRQLKAAAELHETTVSALMRQGARKILVCLREKGALALSESKTRPTSRD